MKRKLSLLQKDVNKCQELLKRVEVESRIKGIVSDDQNHNSDESGEKFTQHEYIPNSKILKPLTPLEVSEKFQNIKLFSMVK